MISIIYLLRSLSPPVSLSLCNSLSRPLLWVSLCSLLLSLTVYFSLSRSLPPSQYLIFSLNGLKQQRPFCFSSALWPM